MTVEGELKMLRVIKRLAQDYPIAIKSTFLGAHAFPTEYKENHSAYIDIIINEMLPKIAEESLADYIDAFLETGYFSVAETERIMEAGKQYGLQAKIHVNQFTAINGIAACVKHNALSVDHLEIVTEEDIEALKNIPTKVKVEIFNILRLSNDDKLVIFQKLGEVTLLILLKRLDLQQVVLISLGKMMIYQVSQFI